MTVTASALVVVMLVSAATVLVVVSAAAFAVVAPTSATFTAQMVQHVLNLLVGGIAVLQYHSRELQCAACQRMVRVNGHPVFLHLGHASHEALLVGIHERDHGSFVDVLMVEVAIDGEHFAVQLVNALAVIFAECLGGLKREIKLFARGETHDLLLESIERYAETADELEGIALLGLLLQVL